MTTFEARAEPLILAALARLEAGGPEALTLRAVAADAGTSTQGVYTCFGGRGGLVAAVRDRVEQQLAAALAPAATPGDVARGVVAFARRRPHAFRLLYDDGRLGLEPVGPPADLGRVGAPAAAWLVVRGAAALALEDAHGLDALLEDALARLAGAGAPWGAER